MTEPQLEHYWARLQLAPGADLLGIKRAYARELKQCRPDTDPQGYQLLREAYDQLVAYVHWQARVAAEQAQEQAAAAADGVDVMPEQAQESAALLGTDTQATTEVAMQLEAADAEVHATRSATETESDAVVASQADTDPDSEESVGFVPPEVLARSLYAYFEEHGAAATSELWPQVYFQLENLPLGLRDEASSWFASLILECPQLPHALVVELAQYFQWHTDYRSQYVLGQERATAMAERLRKLGLIRISDPQVLRRYERILSIKKRLEQGRIWAARVLAVLGTGRVREKAEHTETELLRGLGVDVLIRERVIDLLKFGGRTRLACALMVVLVIAGYLSQIEVIEMWTQQLLVAIAAVIGMRAWVLAAGSFTLRGALGEWSNNRRIGTGILIWAIFCGLSLTDYSVMPVIGFTLGFVLALVWTGQSWCALIIPLSLVLGYVLSFLFDIGWSKAMCLSGLYVLLNHWLLSAHYKKVMHGCAEPLRGWWPQSDLLQLLCLMAGALLLALTGKLLVAAMPMIYFAQSQFYGLRFALTSLGMAVAIAVLVQDQPIRIGVLLAALVLIPILNGQMQRHCDRFARRLARKP